ncbi:hypothetical protein AB0C52_12930 [Streptomyces sp. NPDC048717]|uniref:hypothetical protein n=1 Tax=Streptomyces sp. NPDC048717 TaxID=3154928 RepID=UPI003444042D
MDPTDHVAGLLERALFVRRTSSPIKSGRLPSHGLSELARARASSEWEPPQDLDRCFCDEVGELPDPRRRLHAIRRDVLHRHLTHLERHHRVPRVGLYVHCPDGSVRSTPALTRLLHYASRAGWLVREQLDDCSTAPPIQRVPWRWLVRTVKAGDLDGILASTYVDISPDLDEYEKQLRFVESMGGFVALAQPERGGRR